jgi:hypothetical protein
VHVLAVPPDHAHEKTLRDAVRRLTRTGAVVNWTVPPFDAALRPPWERPAPVAADASQEPAFPKAKPAFGEAAWAAAEAVLVRTRIAQVKGERQLRRLGVRVVRLRPTAARVPDVATEPVETAGAAGSS